MVIDQAFLDDSVYLPEAFFFDEILEVDEERSRLVLRMPTHAELPLTRLQRVIPDRHPRHVNAGLIIHLTGMAGFAHAYHLLGIRCSEGWTPYGARIKRARYKDIAHIGPPLDCDVRATKVNLRKTRGIVEYEFEFSQEGRVVYESAQTAMFVKQAAGA